jgi:hypothetical protein
MTYDDDVTVVSWDAITHCPASIASTMPLVLAPLDGLRRLKPTHSGDQAALDPDIDQSIVDFGPPDEYSIHGTGIPYSRNTSRATAAWSPMSKVDSTTADIEMSTRVPGCADSAVGGHQPGERAGKRIAAEQWRAIPRDEPTRRRDVVTEADPVRSPTGRGDRYPDSAGIHSRLRVEPETR